MAQKSRRAALGGEALRYLLFGVLTTALNMALYALFQALFGYAAANSWGNVLDNILCILFAYATNRRFVFASRTRGRGWAAGWTPRPRRRCGASGSRRSPISWSSC